MGQPISLQRGNIDPATLKLTFIYSEHIQDKDKVWHHVQDEQELVLNEHYRLDKRRGIIELLNHPFWQQEGLWRTADRREPLLYKGQVKWPQVIMFEYEHYTPQEVKESEFREGVDVTAKARLGYDVPKHVIEEPKPTEVPFDWEAAKLP